MTENWSKEISVIDFVLKTDPSTYKTKHSKDETIIRNFYVKELLLSNL